MKFKAVFLILLTIGFGFYSCDKEDFEYEDNYKKSRKAWLSFKTQSGNSYKYTVSGSTWEGASWETVITVDNGEVVQRSFRYTYMTDEFRESSTREPEWTENKDELNSHNYYGAVNIAAETLTLDEVYKKAKEYWLQKREGTTTYFETKNNGIISLCGYIHNDCADDCFIGISITAVEVLK